MKEVTDKLGVETPAAPAPAKPERETSPDDLKTLLSGNAPLSCRLFRALFEHMLGSTLQSGGPQGMASPVNELTGSKEHSRSFLSTALFILGAEIDRDSLMSFMMQQGLFGMPIFEHILQNRDYCEAFHTFRRLERAFIGSPAAEEAQLRNRLDKFNAQFGGKPCGVKIFEIAWSGHALDNERLVEEGVAGAEHDHLVQAARAAASTDSQGA